MVLAAIAILAIPTIREFATVFWSLPDDTHEPIVLAGLLFGFWRDRSVFNWRSSRAARIAALPVSLIAAAAYVTGQSQEFYQLEGLGLIGFVYACLLLATDSTKLAKLSFLAALMLFVIPMPGTLVDALLVPLKLTLTANVARFFAFLGYPVGYEGVVLNVGYYRLGVANACAGLRSLLALSAIGLMFVYLVPARRRLSDVLLVLLLPLLALGANFFRLSLLVLITYYFGGDAGAAAHNWAGYAEIGLSLIGFLVVHRVLDIVFGGKPVRHA